jgi:hypothetical protein
MMNLFAQFRLSSKGRRAAGRKFFRRRRIAMASATVFAVVAPMQLLGAAKAGADEVDPEPGIYSSQPTTTNIYARTPVADDYGVAKQGLGGGAFLRDIGTTLGGNETSIAINPQNPNQIVASAFNGCFACSPGGTDVMYSSDGGNTWTDENVIPAPPPGTGDLGNGPRDQTFDYGRNGVLYGTILVGPNSDLNVYSGSTTDPTGATASWQWNTTGTPATAVKTNSNGTGKTDQPWLLVNSDPTTTSQDDTYVAYDDDSGTGNVDVAAANGTSPPQFTNDVVVGSASGSGTYNQGLRLGTDPLSGDAYALWQKGNGSGAAPNSTNISYMLNRSTNGGASWTLNGSSSGVQIARADDTQVSPKFGTANSLRGGVDSVAVDPTSGDVYVVYGNQDSTAPYNMRLSIVRLVNDGSGNLTPAPAFTSGPVYVTGAVNAALPSVAVAGNGVVGVMYDTFDGFSSLGFPIYSAHLAQSADHGVTFTDQTLETFLSPQLGQNSVQDPNSTQRVLGDYQQLKAVGNWFYGAFPGNGAPFGASQSIINPIFVKTFAGGPQAALTGNLNFGIVPRGTTASQLVTVQDTGTAPLIVNGFSLATGSDAAFSIPPSPGTPQTIQPGGSLQYEVDFSPPATSNGNPRNASLIVQTNDLQNPTITVAVTGTPGVPVAVPSPSTGIAFGQVCASSSSQQELSITNTGNADLTISGVTITGPDAGQFSLASPPPPPVVVHPGGYFDIIIEFNPTSAGAKNATINVSTNDPTNPTISVPLTATGGAGQLLLGTNTLGFRGVPVDDRTSPDSANLPLVLSNQSSCPLTISSLTVGGANPSDFGPIGAPGTPFTIGPDNEVDLTMGFNPGDSGLRTANLTINSSDPSNPTQVVSLNGVGLLPGITMTPAGTLLFPPTVIEPTAGPGGGTTQGVTVTNSGQAELIADSQTTSGPPWTAPGATSPPQRFAVNQSYNVPVTFTPTSVSRKVTGSLTVTDADPEHPLSQTIPFCGEAVGRGIRVLVLDRNGNLYNGITKGKLQSFGLHRNVSIGLKQTTLTTISPPTSCTTIQYDYENQKLPAAYTVNQKQSYYTLSIFEGNQQTNYTFTLMPNEFKLIVLTI